MADADQDRIIGRVVKPHGIRGEVVVDALSDVPGRFDAGVVVSVGDTSRTIASSRPHAGRLLVSFEGIDDRTAAEVLRGLSVAATARALDDQAVYYVHELVGLDVATPDGDWLGEVVGVRELPSVAGYDLLEVDRDGQRWLLPSDDDLVEVATNSDTGEDLLLVFDAPPGLLPDDVAAAVDVAPPDEAAT
ncbi:ribosome maturation factor RimM [Salsipaludibacter albus]|uniref:ribosome maturation factor RimM n=1 Tax=Salsipaludibacter albus TaxID=2849650 RepID=UPI001EE3D8B3|nr:ribosome maturation factor RimM [Salsipaludibacter albus]